MTSEEFQEGCTMILKATSGNKETRDPAFWTKDRCSLAMEAAHRILHARDLPPKCVSLYNSALIFTISAFGMRILRALKPECVTGSEGEGVAGREADR